MFLYLSFLFQFGFVHVIAIGFAVWICASYCHWMQGFVHVIATGVELTHQHIIQGPFDVLAYVEIAAWCCKCSPACPLGVLLRACCFVSIRCCVMVVLSIGQPDILIWINMIRSMFVDFMIGKYGHRWCADWWCLLCFSFAWRLGALVAFALLFVRFMLCVFVILMLENNERDLEMVGTAKSMEICIFSSDKARRYALSWKKACTPKSHTPIKVCMKTRTHTMTYWAPLTTHRQYTITTTHAFTCTTTIVHTYTHNHYIDTHTQTHPGARSLPPPSQAEVRGFENLSSAQRTQGALVFINEDNRNVAGSLAVCCYLYFGSWAFKHKHQERMNTTNKNTRACSCVLFVQQKWARRSPRSVFLFRQDNRQTHKYT